MLQGLHSLTSVEFTPVASGEEVKISPLLHSLRLPIVPQLQTLKVPEYSLRGGNAFAILTALKARSALKNVHLPLRDRRPFPEVGDHLSPEVTRVAVLRREAELHPVSSERSHLQGWGAPSVEEENLREMVEGIDTILRMAGDTDLDRDSCLEFIAQLEPRLIALEQLKELESLRNCS